MPTIAFQGEPGAYSHQACHDAAPGHDPLPCPTFEAVVDAVRGGRAALAMLPVENSTYGRVADIHSLLPRSGLHIVAEAFVRVRIHLLGPPGATEETVRTARSHVVLLGQCRAYLARRGIAPEVAADTAGAAMEVAAAGDPSLGALASEMAAGIYGLDVLARDVEDHDRNTTRFLLMAPEARRPAPGSGPIRTTFVFRVRNIPAALYKAMGGFATNGVNMTKLESYMVDGSFSATQFYADVEGHPEDPPLARALEELRYFSSSVDVLGVYPADPDHFEGGVS